MGWQEPVFDRTAEDLALYSRKAFCNADDLERLEGNLEWLSEQFGIPWERKSWKREDFLRESDFERWEQQLRRLRAAGAVYPSTPAVPAAPWLTIWSWNDAEKILSDLHELYLNAVRDLDYAGEKYSGEKLGGI